MTARASFVSRKPFPIIGAQFQPLTGPAITANWTAAQNKWTVPSTPKAGAEAEENPLDVPVTLDCDTD
jgi:hypothetical protein